MIKHTSMAHKWYYQYRLHTQKSLKLSEDFPELHNFLEQVFEKKPDEYFKQGLSGSKLNFNLKLKIYQLNVHEICELTKEALKQEINKTDHTKVELFFLERDDKTIAAEIPIWIHPEELKSKEIDSILTGHIDILRIENNKIWVWDFKPNAKQEKYASTQLYYYAHMLSKRTGIPIDHFRCGYFDQNDAFIFEPKLEEVL